MYPRPNVLGIVTRNKEILVEEQYGKHSIGTGHYYRPIGGTIEFGEHSKKTLIREFDEELGIQISIIRHIKCIENIFTIDESIGHEITQIYLVEFVEPKLYEVEKFKVVEGGIITYAKWISINEFEEEQQILYPNGLTKILREIS
ncbi:ADP-ribose pyrophosphatase YjhB, NUDIX family [Paenibacillus sp. BC26]|nr:ADP-ribose pyrophosphatase YjhB, NUDIX family [Paenibacillus sp. BC26]